MKEIVYLSLMAELVFVCGDMNAMSNISLLKEQRDKLNSLVATVGQPIQQPQPQMQANLALQQQRLAADQQQLAADQQTVQQQMQRLAADQEQLLADQRRWQAIQDEVAALREENAQLKGDSNAPRSSTEGAPRPSTTRSSTRGAPRPSTRGRGGNRRN